RQLTSSAQDDSHPSFSPNGRRAVFSRNGALFVIPATGGAPRRIAQGPGSARDPSWSPDGKEIVYDYKFPDQPFSDLRLASPDGGASRRLTSLASTTSRPAWSPDGRRVSFQSLSADGHIEIFSIGADGKGLRRESTVATDTCDPAYAPDGGLSYSRDGSIWLRTPGGREEQLTSSGDDA